MFLGDLVKLGGGCARRRLVCIMPESRPLALPAVSEGIRDACFEILDRRAGSACYSLVCMY